MGKQNFKIRAVEVLIFLMH